MDDPQPNLKPAKNKGGRPKKGCSPMTPDVVEDIGAMWLRCCTLRTIAKKVGVSPDTVRTQIEKVLKPIWRDRIWHELQRDMLKTEAIEQESWAKYRESGDLDALALAKWAIEHRAKIGGDYAAAKVDIKQQEMRVAGQTPDEFDEDTVKMILEGMAQRSAYQAAVRGRGVN